MSNYTPPIGNNLPFSFGASGYNAPNGNNIIFQFGGRPKYSQNNDLISFIKVFSAGQTDLTSSVVPKLKNSYTNLGNYIYPRTYSDIFSSILGTHISNLDLNSVISILGIYQNNTYTYLKGCPTIVVGYANWGVQTLKLPCIYGGIRDIGAYLKAEPPNVDLLSYIFASGKYINLGTFIRPKIRQVNDLRGIMKAFTRADTDLVSIVKQWAKNDYDLNKIIHGYDTLNLQFILKSWKRNNTKNLNYLLKGWSRENSLDVKSTLRSWLINNTFDYKSTIRPIVKSNISNLNSNLRIWYLNNSVSLKGYLKQNFNDYLDIYSYLKQNYTSYFDYKTILKGFYREQTQNLQKAIRASFKSYITIPSYIKQTFASTKDISFYLKDYHPSILNLINSLHGWQEFNLNNRITAFHTFDLKGRISVLFNYDLLSILYPVVSVDLRSYITNYHKKDLFSIIGGSYGPGDILSSISPVAPVNLHSIIKSLKEIRVIKDLKSIISSYKTVDLSSYISTIQGFDLGSLLVAKGSFINLFSRIIPKVVFVKRFIPIELLDHLDLKAIINFACFGSEYRVLYSNITAVQKRDLISLIFGWNGSNIVDLGSNINDKPIQVINTIPITSYRNDTPISTSLNISVDKNNMLVYNKIPVNFGTNRTGVLSSGMVTTTNINVNVNKDNILVYNTIPINAGKYGFKSLISYISVKSDTIVDSRVSNLSSFIQPVINAGYNSSPYALPQFIGRETVINIDNNRYNFERDIEFKFKEYVHQYFYVSGEQKVYKFNKSDRWVLRIQGFEYLTDKRVEKGKVLSKYIFNLSKYKTIDDAIVDMIDRVSMFRRFDLNSNITSSGQFSNLNIRLKVKSNFKSYKTLHSEIIVQN